jgi:hypothetical protein
MESKPLLAPRGGLRLDLAGNMISEVEMTGCQNVGLNEGHVSKRRGYPTLGSNLPLDSAIMASEHFYQYDGTDHLLAMTLGLIWKYNAVTDMWDPITTSAALDDCETNWTAAANVSSALDASDYKEGSNSVELTVDAAFTTGIMAYRNDTYGDLSDDSFVRFWIKSSVATEAGDLQLLLDDTAACASPLETLDLPALEADVWTIVVLEFGTPANLTAVASIGIQGATDIGAAVINLDDFEVFESLDSALDDENYWSISSARKESETDVWCIMTNGVDAPMKFTGTPPVSSLIATPPSGVSALLGKHILEFKNHVLLSNTTEDGDPYPNRVRWSDTRTPDDFDSGNAGVRDLNTPGGIMAQLAFKGDYVVLFTSTPDSQNQDIWVGYNTGTTDIFDFDRKVVGKGTVAGMTVANLGEEIIFMGRDDMLIFDGINAVSVGSSVRAEIFGTLNPKYLFRSFGAIIYERKEYWLFLPSSGSEYCDKVWCYNYEMRRWTTHSLADAMMQFGYYLRQESLTIGDLVGTIGDQAWRFGDRYTLESSGHAVFGDQDGYVYQFDQSVNADNGGAIDAWFDTKDFMPTKLYERAQVFRLDLYFDGESLDVYYSIDRGTTWHFIETVENADSYDGVSTYFKVDCKEIRFRYRNDSLSETFSFREARMWWRPAGRRLK